MRELYPNYIPLDWIENKVEEFLTAYKESFLPWDDPALSNWPNSDHLRNILKDTFLYGRESRPNYDAAIAQVRQETLEAEIEHLKKVIYDKSERIKALEKGLFVHPLED